MATAVGGSQWSLIAAISRKKNNSTQLLSTGFSQTPILSRNPRFKLCSSPLPFHGAGHIRKKTDIHVVTPDISSPSITPELLDAWNDDYNGVVINPESLPISANAFASSLRASLSNWKLKGKKGVWLKILQEQADLVPIAIQEGFDYHHAESGYVMLTYWIPDDLCMLPGSPSHQIGIGAFVFNYKKEVLVVKEKCPCSCSGVWKFPTGYINKSEDIFSGAVREVKEETGVSNVYLLAYHNHHQ
ncbi:hypothetical protein TIFTF001_019818 [Ficus carica]|uniref:Nudix hydrolase domain-containing protein n=1 Tax=Ficus carica TaxID=3494 RepID=A0AA88DJH3_FICCA|nr:hypothetical protein TIFTF001_019818 [Ficus carica]